MLLLCKAKGTNKDHISPEITFDIGWKVRAQEGKHAAVYYANVRANLDAFGYTAISIHAE